MPRAYKWLIVIALVIILPWAGCQLVVRSHRLSFVPEAMGVWRVLYAAEESWGFGPGGNETGIIVYAMPREVAWIGSCQRMSECPRRGRS